MTNSCMFLIKIAGREEAVCALANQLANHAHSPTIRSFKEVSAFAQFIAGPDQTDFIVEPTGTPGIVSLSANGDCAWSVKTAMRSLGQQDNGAYLLDTETERLHLAVEVYSEEPDIGFQEHLFLVNGVVLTDECVDYAEISTLNISDADLRDQLSQVNLTPETAPAPNENGDIPVGGFGAQYGDFSALDRCIPELAKYQVRSSLSSQIKDANQRCGTTKENTKREVLEHE